STKVSPVSSAGSTPKCDCGSSSMPSPCSSAATSRVLPSLLLARTTRMGLLLQGLPLQLDQLGDAFAGQCRHLVELLQPEGMAFGGALQLDERAGIAHHHVHVGLGLRIFQIVEIENGLAAVDADRDRGHLAMQHRALYQAAPAQMIDGVR